MYELILLFFIVAFLSIVVGTVAGFGTSTIFLPMALFFPGFSNSFSSGGHHPYLWKCGCGGLFPRRAG